MKKELIVRLHASFEDAAHHEDGVEFWLGRELQVLLGYAKWENFEQVINKAKTACANAGYTVADHFPDVGRMVEIGSGQYRSPDKRSASGALRDVTKTPGCGLWPYPGY
ncbi:MAG: hypothetical protein WKG03_19050 [Telluria sp.]